MSLRFRKSIKIAPGVRLGINKNSVGVSAGVKGYRKSINSSGRLTTSVGIPGTGISYVTSKNVKNKSKKVATKAVSVTSQNSVSSQSAAAPETNVPKPRVRTLVADPPGISTFIIGIIVLVIAFFVSGSSWLVAIGIAILGIVLVYSFIDYKRKPDSDKYVSEDQLKRWRQLLSVDSGSVYELSKKSLPLLLELKENAIRLFSEYNKTSNNSQIGIQLLEIQKTIVDFSEFVVLNGENPTADLEKYSSMLSKSE